MLLYYSNIEELNFCLYMLMFLSRGLIESSFYNQPFIHNHPLEFLFSQLNNESKGKKKIRKERKTNRIKLSN